MSARAETKEEFLERYTREFVAEMLAECVADGRAEIVGYTPDGRPCYRSTKYHGMPLTGDVSPIN